MKTLTALTSIATLVLFVGVVATSPATPKVFGIVGSLCAFLLAPGILYASASANGLRRAGYRPWVGRACFTSATVLVLLGLYTLVFNPSRFVDSSPAVTGVLALLMVGLTGSAIFPNWWARHYRRCPECKAMIRTDVTRCRYCTAEVPALKIELPPSL